MTLRTFKISAIMFALLLTTSSFVYYTRSNPYVRPEPYFYLLSIAAGVVFLQIINLKEKSSLAFFVIFLEVLLVSLSFILTQQALYKTVMGRDPWGHMVLTRQIIELGHIPDPADAWVYSVYTRMPEFHILNAFIMLVEGINYKWASQLVGIGILLSLTLLIGALVSQVFKLPQLVLLSILFTATADNVLNMSGKNIVPNALGVVLVLLALYILLIILPKAPNKALFLLALTIFSLVFMHSVSYGFLLIELSIFVVLLLVADRKERKIACIIGGILITSIVLAFLEWGIWDVYYLKQAVLLLKWLFLGVGVGRYKHEVSTVPLYLIILARLGMIIYLAIAGLSILWEVLHSSKARTRMPYYKLAFTLESMFFVGIALPITFFWAGIAHRFWYYGEILGSVFVGLVFLKLGKLGVKYNYIGKIIGVSVISVLLFLMFTASIANDDNPLVPQYTVRTGWYDSEVSGALFSVSHRFHPLSDFDFYINNKYVAICTYERLPDFVYKKPSIMAVRPFVILHRYFFWRNRGYIPIHKNCISKMSLEFSFIYSSGGVIMYACSPCDSIC